MINRSVYICGQLADKEARRLWGIRRFSFLGYLLVLVVVVIVGNRLLIFTLLICSLLCLWKAARELRKERKKERDEGTFLNSNFILGFNNHFFLKPVETVASPRQGVGIY